MEKKTSVKKESKVSAAVKPEKTSQKSETVTIFNLLGKQVEIESWKLDQKKVEEAAQKFFKRNVKAVPMWIEPEWGKDLYGYLGVGWSFWGVRINTETYIGYLAIDGQFSWYPENQGTFGIPLKEEGKMAGFLGVKIFYANGKIQFK